MRLVPLTVIAAACVLSLAALLPAAAQTRAVPENQAEIQLSFAPVVERTAPAVVNVYTKRVVRRKAHPFFDDPFFNRFFGDGFFGLPRERVARSLGSGVLVSKDGLVVTNNHVVGGRDTEILVVLNDRREFEAKVLLTDERTDLAVLKLDTDGEALPHVTFGDSDTLAVGDLVLAIGNPFGVGQTVTSGIVSALARTARGISDYQFFIQTDAAINPGNSGGALVDMKGRLVGINTAIYSRSGGSNGIGFAIPANMVRVIVESARTGGDVVRPWLGAELQPVTQDIADSLGLDRPLGALVRSLHEDSPLVAAGLKRGDVVLALDGREIDGPKELTFRFATKSVGGTAELSYWRGGERHEAEIALISPPESTPRKETTIRGRTPFSGLIVANLSPALADELRLSSDSEGVAVIDIAGGPARRVGFKKGDIVLEINDRKIERVDDMLAAVDEDARRWQFAIRRKGRVIKTTIGG